MYAVLKVLPKNTLSYLTGRLSEIVLPRPLSSLLVKFVASRLGLNELESEHSFGKYRSVQELFTRRLKPNARPIMSSLVSPVDGVVREIGSFAPENFMLVKDRSYSLSELLGCSKAADSLGSGAFFNFYLRPRDYHRVHAPCKLKILKRIYIPGKLWPVNSWALQEIPNLFAVNERVVLIYDSEFGPGALVLVGAYNVGRIGLSFESLLPNPCPAFREEAVQTRNFDPPIELQVGGELGVFRLGSSVVMLLAKQVPNRSSPIKAGLELKMGGDLTNALIV